VGTNVPNSEDRPDSRSLRVLELVLLGLAVAALAIYLWFWPATKKAEVILEPVKQGPAEATATAGGSTTP
jgi:hypothetical protein